MFFQTSFVMKKLTGIICLALLASIALLAKTKTYLFFEAQLELFPTLKRKFFIWSLVKDGLPQATETQNFSSADFQSFYQPIKTTDYNSRTFAAVTPIFNADFVNCSPITNDQKIKIDGMVFPLTKASRICHEKTDQSYRTSLKS